MQQIYLLRHAKRTSEGVLTNEGRADAKQLGVNLPQFDAVYASDSDRAVETAELISGMKPKIDTRASFYTAPKEKSDAYNKLCKEKGIDFLEAVRIYNDPEVNEGIAKQAQSLNEMIDELLQSSSTSILVVSHNLTMIPAIEKRGLKTNLLLDYLNGYVIDGYAGIEEYLSRYLNDSHTRSIHTPQSA